MSSKTIFHIGLAIVLVALLALASTVVRSNTKYFAADRPVPAQTPLFMRDAAPPLNMLVMGKDHKNYYEAYNDASDLDGDGIVDVGYRGWELKDPAPDDGSSAYKIDYYGYFNSYACYSWSESGSRFVPASATSNKQCGGEYWSGDFLNYLTTSRMDALRRVLYGGWRHVDTEDETVLQGAFFPQDAHSWGKEYYSIERDGYDIRHYAPASMGVPGHGRYHLFAVTTVTDTNQSFPNYTAPLFRVLENSPFRVWNWLSMEGPVAGNRCFTEGNVRVDCVNTGVLWDIVPGNMYQNLTITTWRRASGTGSPANQAGMDSLFNDHAIPGNLCGSGPVSIINTSGGDNNPFAGTNSCTHDNYLTRIEGQLVIEQAGTYRFLVDGDDAVDVFINGARVSHWYGGHGSNRSGTGSGQTPGNVTLQAGVHNIVFRHQEAAGDDNWGLMLERASGADSLVDRVVRVLACPDDADLRDPSCRAYPNGTYKPTGILHEYGEEQRMYFGLITGTQRNNLQGGVLRRNISNFADEVNATTGQFRTDIEGIVRSIDRLRMIGGGYNGSTTDNLNSDTNWNWANTDHGVGGNCASQGHRSLNNGECRMWGNPIAEMMFEAVRYFAGAGSATDAFSGDGSSEGRAEDTRLGLAEPDWMDPYAATGEGGLGYASCSRPVQTVISDINPSYDGHLPGSAWDAMSGDGGLPGFNASSQGQAIWDLEFGAGSRDVFIGQVGASTDGAPTLKSASSFGNIRGLSPEEPTKEGTYYAASVARYAALNALNPLAEDPYMTTYSVALASPLPRMSIPVGGRTVELIPFGKTVSGTFGDQDRKPTNTIVDFYVETIANFPAYIEAGQQDMNVNGGRAYAIFRINYEDVEQGNDHDMDMIVRYEIIANDNNTLTVNLSSDYASGSANQNAGYVISGTTRDGVYLEVRDSDSQQSTSVYDLNTPPGRWAGECEGLTGTSPCNQGLTLSATRTFEVGSTGAGTQLRDPLWYAAKYGTPTSIGTGVGSDGEPENYFLVTNPLNLRAQLARAFDNAAQLSLDAGNAAVSGARVGSASFTLQPTFARQRNGNDWTGNLTALAINADGSIGSALWNAQAGIAATATRNIRTIHSPGTGTNSTREASAFTVADLPGSNDSQLEMLGINPAQVSTLYGASYSAADFIDYIGGGRSREAGNGGTLRARSSVLGSIINSEPVIASPRSDFGYGMYPAQSMFSGYGDFLTQKREANRTFAYVGANDGMLHAFRADTITCPTDPGATCAPATSGREAFAFVPNDVLDRLGEIALPDDHYNHRYYVDGQITVSDARRGGETDWRTLLAGTTGGGGRSVFVLDVTNPDSFGNGDVLWERNASVDDDIGYTYGKPLIVPLENNQWGVLFGNGYGGSTSDPSLYILNAFTGEVIRKLIGNDGNPASSDDSIADLVCGTLGLPCANNDDPFNGLGQITAIDSDGNGKVDTVYGGDLQGNLWKFDLSASNASGWQVANSNTPLFTAERNGNRQPITGGIRVAAGPGGGVMVYFGTGRYLYQSDANVPANPEIQSLYGIFDNGTAVGIAGRTALAAQGITGESISAGRIARGTTRNAVAYYGSTARRGWYVDLAVNRGTTADPDLEALGERFIATPLIQSGRVFFPTYTPLGDSCEPGGLNFAYGLDLLSGAGTLTNVSVLPGGDAACTGDDCAAVSIGEGAPVTSTSAVATIAEQEIPCFGDACPDPDDGSGDDDEGATFEQCQVVIYPGAFVLPRPCGRQSWRQLR